MSHGYAVGVVINAIMVAAALWPPARPRRLALVAYQVGLPGNEIPLLLMLLFTVSTVDAVTSNRPISVVDWIVLAAGIAIIAGYGRLHINCVLARRVMPEAVGAELAAPAWWRTIFPWPIKPPAVQRLRDLPYGGLVRRQRMDILRRRDATCRNPVLVYLHGGGYFTGNKNFEARALRYRFAARGWVVVSANYRLRPHVGWPEHLVDAKRVIAWVREHAEDYGMDADQIVLSGSSAGAHLSVLAALTQNDPALQPGFTGADTSVAGVVGLYGYYGRYYGRDAGEQPASTPLALPAHSAPPMLIVHGAKDSYTPVAGARALVVHLRSQSHQPVAYAELPGAQHGFDVLHSYRFDTVLRGIEAFCSQLVSERWA